MFQLWQVTALREGLSIEVQGPRQSKREEHGEDKCEAGKEGGGERGACKAGGYKERDPEASKCSDHATSEKQCWSCGSVAAHWGAE